MFARVAELPGPGLETISAGRIGSSPVHLRFISGSSPHRGDQPRAVRSIAHRGGESVCVHVRACVRACLVSGGAADRHSSCGACVCVCVCVCVVRRCCGSPAAGASTFCTWSYGTTITSRPTSSSAAMWAAHARAQQTAIRCNCACARPCDLVCDSDAAFTVRDLGRVCALVWPDPSP